MSTFLGVFLIFLIGVFFGIKIGEYEDEELKVGDICYWKPTYTI